MFNFKKLFIMRNLKLRNAIGVFIVFAVLSITAVTSCTNDDEPRYEVQTEQSIDEVDMQFAEFLQSVDSLQSQYPVIETRGFVSGAAVCLADEIGSLAGRHLGGYIGGAIGSIFANPFGTIIGYGFGRQVGPAIFGALSSGLVSLATECVVLNSRVSGSRLDAIELKADFNIITRSDGSVDSSGYYHNVIMVKVAKDYDKYVQNNVLDKSLLYDDIVRYSAELGVYDSIFNNPAVKKLLIQRLDEICDINLQYEKGNISKEEFIELHAENLKNTYGIDDSEIYRFKKFAAEQAEYCAKLDENSLHEYAKDLNDAIWKSNMSSSQKEEVASTARMVVNSTLCWNQ